MTILACKLPTKFRAQSSQGPPFEPFSLSPQWMSNTQFINIISSSPKLLACVGVHIPPVLP